VDAGRPGSGVVRGISPGIAPPGGLPTQRNEHGLGSDRAGRCRDAGSRFESRVGNGMRLPGARQLCDTYQKQSVQILNIAIKIKYHMHHLHRWLTLGLIVTAISAPAIAQSGTCAGMTPGQLTSLNGFVPFPVTNAWNTDISSMSFDPASDTIINYIGGTKPVHPDFGSGT